MSQEFSDDTPCEKLPLPVRAKTALMFAEIKTFGQLKKFFGRDLLDTPNFGRTSYKAIEEFLASQAPATDGTKFWKARGESRRFTFEAYGQSEADALSALQRGFEVHARQYQLEPTWYQGAVDIHTQRMAFGSAYRDNEEMPSA